MEPRHTRMLHQDLIVLLHAACRGAEERAVQESRQESRVAIVLGILANEGDKTGQQATSHRNGHRDMADAWTVAGNLTGEIMRNLQDRLRADPHGTLTMLGIDPIQYGFEPIEEVDDAGAE